MNCKECLSIVEEYVENSLDPQISDQTAAHIFDCGSCRKVYEELKNEQEIYSRYLLKIKEKPESWDAVRTEFRKGGSVAAANAGTAGGVLSERLAAFFFPQRLAGTMATLVLMIGIGLGVWYLISVQKNESVPGAASSTESSLSQDKNNRTLADNPLTKDGNANLTKDESQKSENDKGRTAKNALTTYSVRPRHGRKSAEAINPLADTINNNPVSFDSSEAAFNRHIEKCEMVLRSFRNAVMETDKSGFDISYERRLAKELLNNSVNFRREAQSQGNLPIENLLVDLEAILSGITKLPNKVTSSDADLIKGRIEESGIIAKLQVQSSIARAFD